MLPFSKILCPTDFKEAAQAALSAAAELADLFWAELTILHVVEPLRALACIPEGAGFVIAPHAAAAVTDGLVDAAADTLRHLTGRLPASLSHRERIVFGTPAAKILEIAHAEKVDLIVMGTRGRAGWSHLLFGSLAEAVCKSAPCPVMVVHRAVD